MNKLHSLLLRRRLSTSDSTSKLKDLFKSGYNFLVYDNLASEQLNFPKVPHDPLFNQNIATGAYLSNKIYDINCLEDAVKVDDIGGKILLCEILSFDRDENAECVAYLVRNESNLTSSSVWIVSRGTNNLTDVLFDASWVATTSSIYNIKVPVGVGYRAGRLQGSIEGFLEKARNYLEKSKRGKNLSNFGENNFKLYFCGHSLGGAVSIGLFLTYIGKQMQKSPDVVSLIKKSHSMAPEVFTFGSPLALYSPPKSLTVTLRPSIDSLTNIMKTSLVDSVEVVKNYQSEASSILQAKLENVPDFSNIKVSENIPSSFQDLLSKSTAVLSKINFSRQENNENNYKKPDKSLDNCVTEDLDPSIETQSEEQVSSINPKEIFPKTHIPLHYLANRIHNVVFQFDLVPRLVGNHDFPAALMSSSVLSSSLQKFFSLTSIRRENYSAFGYYYLLLSKGSELRRLTQHPAATASGSTNPVYQQEERNDNSTIGRFLSTFPPTRSNIAFALIHDHQMSNIYQHIKNFFKKNLNK